jgi:hypothetical protein
LLRVYNKISGEAERNNLGIEAAHHSAAYGATALRRNPESAAANSRGVGKIPGLGSGK